jgi:hypothetical protein
LILAQETTKRQHRAAQYVVKWLDGCGFDPNPLLWGMLGERQLAKPRSRWFCVVLAASGFCAGAAAPSIIITNLPPYGSTNNLGGMVLNASPAACSVAVFIYVPGYGWVTKPNCAQPLTSIQPNGSWSADITTGGSDTLATRIAALLVSTNYSQPCVLGSNSVPTNVFAQAIASAVVTRAYPGPRWLSFSGYDWWVKTSAGRVGPGPNYFSDSTNNVWLDGQGQLHLRITNRSNQWQCAELVSARTFGYGSYRFQLASSADSLNPNAVLGLFTWSDDAAYADREIDIECSRWGNAADASNAQFVVQPYDVSGHLVRLTVPAGQTNAALRFTWETNRVSFQSQRGGFSPNPSPANVISNWTYTLTVPPSGDEAVRLNLWLFRGTAPTDNQEVEVVISSFQFMPLGTPQPARLKAAAPFSASPFRFVLQGEFDRWYQVQVSTDLLAWKDLATMPATNPVVDFGDSTAGGFNRRFYRTATLP